MHRELLLVITIACSGCLTGCIIPLVGKGNDRIAEAYDKYHPTYGTRNELPQKDAELNDDGESIWQRPPQRVAVRRTPDGPETGPHGRAAITDDYVGYEAADIPVLQQELGAHTRNLTTRQPVEELPDYLRGDYGSSAYRDKAF